jgi:hypothetical protein
MQDIDRWQRVTRLKELAALLKWAFTGKTEDVASRLIQWWVRISAIWIFLLTLVVVCTAVSVVLQPSGINPLMVWFTLEGGAVLAMAGPLVLAVALFILYYVIFAVVFIGVVVGWLLDLIAV